VAECPVGQFATGARCRSCDVIGCLVCPSEGVCARCEQPLWLLNRTCAASCPPGYHGNTATRACDGCDEACRTCADGVSASVCTSCHATRALNDGACVDECPRDRLLSRAACVDQCPQTSLCNVVLNSGTSHHIPCLSVCLSQVGVLRNFWTDRDRPSFGQSCSPQDRGLRLETVLKHWSRLFSSPTSN